MDSSKDRPITVSATVLGEIRAEIGEVHGICQANSEHLQNLIEHVSEVRERVARLEARANGHDDRIHTAEKRFDGQALHDEDAGQAAHTYRTGEQRSPSNLYAAVGEKIERQGEEVTERLKLEAIVAAKEAVAEELAEHSRVTAERLRQEAEVAAAQLRADTETKASQLKLENDRKIAEIEQKQKRSMSRITVVGAFFAMLIASGVFAAVKSLFSTEAVQAEQTRVLKRIEAKQAKITVPKPDAAVEP